jgi:hypothetical protein
MSWLNWNWKRDREYRNKKVKTIFEGRKRKAFGKTFKVLAHLELHGSITSMEAFQEYNATRLSGIIYTLRKQGYNIITKKTYSSNQSGYTYATYYLEQN